MKAGGTGGDRPNAIGLAFEEETDLAATLRGFGFTVCGTEVRRDDDLVAWLVPQHGVYSFAKNEFGIDWKSQISSKSLPDEALYVIASKTLHVVEKKQQTVGGSVDEKLRGGPFLLARYRQLFAGTGVKVELAYLLGDWFLQDKYRDEREHLARHGIPVYFGSIPLTAVGLGSAGRPARKVSDVAARRVGAWAATAAAAWIAKYSTAPPPAGHPLAGHMAHREAAVAY